MKTLPRLELHWHHFVALAFAQVAYGYVGSLMTSMVWSEQFAADYGFDFVAKDVYEELHARVIPGPYTLLVFATVPLGAIVALATTFIPVRPVVKYGVATLLSVVANVVMVMVKSDKGFIACRFFSALFAASAVYTLTDCVTFSRWYLVVLTPLYFLGGLILAWVIVGDEYKPALWLQVGLSVAQVLITGALLQLEAAPKPHERLPSLFTAGKSFISGFSSFQVIYYFISIVAVNLIWESGDGIVFAAIAFTICFGVSTIGAGVRHLIPKHILLIVGYTVLALCLVAVVVSSSQVRHHYAAAVSAGGVFLYVLVVATSLLVVPIRVKEQIEQPVHHTINNLALFVVMFASPYGLSSIGNNHLIVFIVVDILLAILAAIDLTKKDPDE